MTTKNYDVTLVTYANAPDLISDDRILYQALREKGASVRAAVWDDQNVDWSASPVTVSRSMWDYFHKIPTFETWLNHVGSQTRVFNSPDTMRWNMHKRYLNDLAARGVNIVPTRHVARGEISMLTVLCAAEGWDDIVVKPAISGSAFGARRFTAEAIERRGQSYLDELCTVRDMMIQPYVKTVEEERERSFVFIGGSFSHALLKAPFSAGAAAGEMNEQLYVPTSEELNFASVTLAALPEQPAYGRVDFVWTEGRCALMEMELIEPNLFFRFSSTAAVRLADILLN